MFDDTNVAPNIVGVTLQIVNPASGYVSGDSSETLSLFDVSTSIAALQSTGSGQTAIYTDLGSGVGFGSKSVSSADNNSTINIPLNAAAVAHPNNNRGTKIAIGGALTSISGGATQVVFASSGASSAQLVLQFGDGGGRLSSQRDCRSALHITTSMPGDGSGDPLNTLDPKMQVLNGSGTVLATNDNSAGDGHNAHLDYAPAVSGVYYVKVSESPMPAIMW